MEYHAGPDRDPSWRNKQIKSMFEGQSLDCTVLVFLDGTGGWLSKPDRFRDGQFELLL